LEGHALKLLIILGSTREERFGKKMADWYVPKAKEASRFDEIEFIDLADINLPMSMEPKSPSNGPGSYTHEYTKEWSKIISSADAFVLLTPEYNHSFSAALKNALDHVYFEWGHKPVALVSWGTVGGARAIQSIAPVLRALEMVLIRKDINIFPWRGDVTETGQIKNERAEQAIDAQIDLLSHYAKQLKTLRNNIA